MGDDNRSSCSVGLRADECRSSSIFVIIAEFRAVWRRLFQVVGVGVRLYSTRFAWELLSSASLMAWGYSWDIALGFRAMMKTQLLWLLSAFSTSFCSFPRDDNVFWTFQTSVPHNVKFWLQCLVSLLSFAKRSQTEDSLQILTMRDCSAIVLAFDRWAVMNRHLVFRSLKKYGFALISKMYRKYIENLFIGAHPKVSRNCRESVY